METLGISDAKTDAIFVPVEWREHPRPITLRPPIERQSEPVNSISNPGPCRRGARTMGFILFT